MAAFDKCPVCGGGAIAKKKVDKVVRVGDLSEIVKVQAEVCLRCGERLYAPAAVKHVSQIRSKLQREAKANPQSTAWGRLLDKLDYEVWFLDYLEKRYDMIGGNHYDLVIRITNGEQPSSHEITFDEYFCINSGPDSNLLNAMMPLTFVASFKTLDMIFEWILGENHKSGNIPKVPWNFSDKVKILTQQASNLQLPDPFKNHPPLYDYAKALFCQLMPYRHEVVHKNRFSVSGDTLTLSDSKAGTSLTLNGQQVDRLVRFALALVRVLTKQMVVDRKTDKLLKYYLNGLAPIHGLPTFNQRQMPFLVHVELTLPKCGASFPADLKRVRDEVKRRFSSQEMFFDLKVRAVEGETLIATWYFSPEEVPDLDMMIFYEESHKAHRVEIIKNKR